jgi:CRP-like cAMP-binding protein
MNTGADGRTSTFTGVPAGGWFGEGSLLKTEARRYDVVALRASRIAWVPRRMFEWLLNTSLPFNRFVLVQTIFERGFGTIDD